MKIKMKAISCVDVTPSIYNGNISCSLKPTRDGSGLTSALYNFRRPAGDLWLHIYSSYKYGTIFRSWMTNTDFDICAGVKNLNSVPYFGQLFYNGLQKTVPGLAHECPYKNVEGFRNVSVDKVINSVLPQIIPKGEYKVFYRVHTKANVTFVTLTMNILVDAVDPLKSILMGKK